MSVFHQAEKRLKKRPGGGGKSPTSLHTLTKGDALIVSELSRPGRSRPECMEILALATQKGIRVYAGQGQLAA